ncbi:MAG TPA: hypothetical protein EYG88_05290 [Desulfocapsa sulfexigens]|nr:hypothetical protein [Desulfocapsa sulfexigens]
MKTKCFFSRRGIACTLIAFFFTVPSCLFAADKAKFGGGGIEHHFVMNDLTHIDEQYMPVMPDPAVVIPGTSNQYQFKIKLGQENPLANNEDFEVDLASWYFPTTVHTVFELSFTGPVSERAQLEKLQEQTFSFLKERGMLSKNQISKTQTFFNVYLPQE